MPETAEKPRRKPDGLIEAFTDIVARMNDGSAPSELAEGMRVVVASVLQTGQGGSITYTLRVKPGKKEGTIILTDKVVVNAPTPGREEVRLFARDNGEVATQPFNQGVIPFDVKEKTA